MSTNQYVIKSAQRTLEVLLEFANAPHRFSLADLQLVTGVEKNQLYRSLKTLEASGYLQVDSAGRYSLTELMSSLQAGLPGRPKSGTVRSKRSRRPREAGPKALASD
jgi:predicted ArsR family transcriptional regulator